MINLKHFLEIVQCYKIDKNLFIEHSTSIFNAKKLFNSIKLNKNFLVYLKLSVLVTSGIAKILVEIALQVKAFEVAKWRQISIYPFYNFTLPKSKFSFDKR